MFMRIIKDLLFFLMWYPFRVMIAFLPLSVVDAVGRMGGFILYSISKEKRWMMTEELRRSLPNPTPASIRRIVKASFANYALSELEVLLYPTLNPTIIQNRISLQGREYLEEALSQGKGVLLFQAHFGAFQMVMPVIGYHGYTMNQISASAAVWKERMNSDIQKKVLDIKASYEQKLPVRHISVQESLRPVFRALERNEIVGITVDGGTGKKNINIRFLNRWANFAQGPVGIALRTGAPIVPAFILTGKRLNHILRLHPPLVVDPALDKNESIRRILQQFARLLEGYVFEYPEHYGYTLYFRRANVPIDPYPFFKDYIIPPSGKGDFHEGRA